MKYIIQKLLILILLYKPNWMNTISLLYEVKREFSDLFIDEYMDKQLRILKDDEIEILFTEISY